MVQRLPALATPRRLGWTALTGYAIGIASFLCHGRLDYNVLQRLPVLLPDSNVQLLHYIQHVTRRAEQVDAAGFFYTRRDCVRVGRG